MPHNVFQNLECRCDICGMQRPENRISVRKIDFSLAAGLAVGTATENVRYCNDMDMCKELAMKKKASFTQTSAAVRLKREREKVDIEVKNAEKAVADNMAGVRQYLKEEPERQRKLKLLRKVSWILWFIAILWCSLLVVTILSGARAATWMDWIAFAFTALCTALMPTMWISMRKQKKYTAELRRLADGEG